MAELRRFATFEQLRHSRFFKVHEAEIRRLLDEPRVYRSENARPRLRSFLRVVEWNIERGAHLEGIVGVLTAHPVLRFADLLLVNELDDGMIRSGNLNIALELSKALSAHAIFGVEYLELTRGVGDELALEGENTAALHGNAILTRHAFSNPQVIRLPRCENNFESKERRIGGRIGIILDLEIDGKRFIAGNTHLDVINTPRCRAKTNARDATNDGRSDEEPGRHSHSGHRGRFEHAHLRARHQAAGDEEHRDYSCRQPQ